MPPTREAIANWISRASLRSEDYLFPSRLHGSPHLSTRQYARVVARWVREIGLDPAGYGTHTLRDDSFTWAAYAFYGDPRICFRVTDV